MRRDDPYHDWLLDEPLLWFALWLLCIAAWIAMSVLLPPSLPDTIIACSPTLLAAFFSALWMRPAIEWVADRRWRRFVQAVADKALPGPLTLPRYPADPNETGNFPWGTGDNKPPGWSDEQAAARIERFREGTPDMIHYRTLYDPEVTELRVRDFLLKMRDQKFIDPNYGYWNGGAQDAAGEGETPPGS